MKRQFYQFKEDSKQSTSTPSSELPHRAKRTRRSPHHQLYESPVLGLQAHFKESPDSEYRNAPRLSGTAQKKFENFTLNTPVAGLAKTPKVGTNALIPPRPPSSAKASSGKHRLAGLPPPAPTSAHAAAAAPAYNDSPNLDEPDMLEDSPDGPQTADTTLPETLSQELAQHLLLEQDDQVERDDEQHQPPHSSQHEEPAAASHQQHELRVLRPLSQQQRPLQQRHGQRQPRRQAAPASKVTYPQLDLRPSTLVPRPTFQPPPAFPDSYPSPPIPATQSQSPQQPAPMQFSPCFQQPQQLAQPQQQSPQQPPEHPSPLQAPQQQRQRPHKPHRPFTFRATPSRSNPHAAPAAAAAASPWEDFALSSQLDSYRPSQVELRQAHSSQLLQPAGGEDDGFVLHCSQTYTRNSSLHSGQEEEEEGEEEVHTPTELAAKLEGIPAPLLAAAGVLPAAEPSASDVTAVMSVGGPLLPTQASGIPCGNQQRTPDLEAVAASCNPDDEATAAPQLAPIFRPRAERKHLVLVRHGESEYNRADMESKHTQDPHLFDAKLTGRGRRQAAELADKLRAVLAKFNAGERVLWVVSPLTRAIETLALGCPFPERLGVAQAQPGTQHAPLNVAVLSCISEHVATTGDIGRPPHVLSREFPWLAARLGHLADTWWHSRADAPNCSSSRQFKSKESVEQLKRRCQEFKLFLNSRTEKVIVCIGHSTFWKMFTNEKTRLKNCEVRTMLW